MRRASGVCWHTLCPDDTTQSGESAGSTHAGRQAGWQPRFKNAKFEIPWPKATHWGPPAFLKAQTQKPGFVTGLEFLGLCDLGCLRIMGAERPTLKKPRDGRVASKNGLPRDCGTHDRKPATDRRHERNRPKAELRNHGRQGGGVSHPPPAFGRGYSMERGPVSPWRAEESTCEWA